MFYKYSCRHLLNKTREQKVVYLMIREGQKYIFVPCASYRLNLKCLQNQIQQLTCAVYVKR